MKRRLLQLAVSAIVFLTFAAPVLANSSFWSFRMYNQVVDGQRNGVFHQMTAGSLTNRGQIWIESWDAGSIPPDVAEVYIDVYKDNGWWGDERYCRLFVTPYRNGSSKQFYKSCGSIPSGSYYIYAEKLYNDGRNIGAQGDLISN